MSIENDMPRMIRQPQTKGGAILQPLDGRAAENKTRLLLLLPQELVRSGLLALFEPSDEFLVVGTASTARECLVLAAQLHPTVVLMDVELPDMDAVTFIQHLQRDVPDARALVLSADMFWGNVIAVFRAGAWGYMAKERPVEWLREGLRVVARGYRYLDGQTGGKLAQTWGELPGTATEIALASLSRRENEVFALLVAGKNTREICKSLYISRKTVETHRRAVLRKLKVRDTAELMKFAVRNRLINP